MCLQPANLGEFPFPLHPARHIPHRPAPHHPTSSRTLSAKLEGRCRLIVVITDGADVTAGVIAVFGLSRRAPRAVLSFLHHLLLRPHRHALKHSTLPLSSSSHLNSQPLRWPRFLRHGPQARLRLHSPFDVDALHFPWSHAYRARTLRIHTMPTSSSRVSAFAFISSPTSIASKLHPPLRLIRSDELAGDSTNA